MKTIGLLGGMSWESTALYYRRINERTRERLGGLHSARIAMISVDFAEIEALQAAGAWDAAGEALALDARRLEAAGQFCKRRRTKGRDTMAACGQLGNERIRGRKLLASG